MQPSDQSDREIHYKIVELLDELRVILPGATVLFAFLLAVPFQNRFSQLSAVPRGAYFLAFMCVAFALALLVGESAYHRIRGGPYDRARMLRTASHQAIAALVLLMVAVSAVAFLVTSVLYGPLAATLVSAGVLVFTASTWFGLPLLRRRAAR